MYLPLPPLRPHHREQNLQLRNVPVQKASEDSDRDTKKTLQHRQQGELASISEFLVGRPGADG